MNDLGSMCVDTPAQLIYFRLNGWIIGDFIYFYARSLGIRWFFFFIRTALPGYTLLTLPPCVTLVLDAFMCACMHDICLVWRLIGLK